ncbi:hypothetical protein BH09PLA1_BH09PLA1_15350 [soil metagenome]
MRFAFAAACAAGLLVSSSIAQAALPLPYTVQLQARASIGSGASTFNLPAGSAFSSATPDINNNRKVVFKTTVTGSTGFQGIWYGMADPSNALGSGAMAYAPNQDIQLSDPTLNNSNFSVFPQTLSSANGIYKYDPGTGNTTLLTNGPLGASSWANPRMNDSGQVGTRVSFASGQAYVSYANPPSNATNIVHATDVAADSNSPYSFLNTSNFDNNRRIAGRVNVGASFNNANPDEILLFNPDGTSTLIARDRDASATSPYFQFDNTTLGMNDNGFVAFISRTTTAASTRSVFLSNGTTDTLIAAPGSLTTAGTTITSIDNFSPNVNNSNLVVFRATDSAGTIGVFVGDGVTLQRIARIGDMMQTDIGSFAVNSLGGNPTINDLGDVAFGGGLGAGGNFIAAALVPEPGTTMLLAAFAGGALARRSRKNSR